MKINKNMVITRLLSALLALTLLLTLSACGGNATPGETGDTTELSVPATPETDEAPEATPVATEGGSKTYTVAGQFSVDIPEDNDWELTQSENLMQIVGVEKTWTIIFGTDFLNRTTVEEVINDSISLNPTGDNSPMVDGIEPYSNGNISGTKYLSVHDDEVGAIRVLFNSLISKDDPVGYFELVFALRVDISEANAVFNEPSIQSILGSIRAPE